MAGRSPSPNPIRRTGTSSTPLSNQRRNSSDSPREFLDHKENSANPRARSSCSGGIKNFMAPTFAAASKAVAALPRKKILSERNDMVGAPMKFVQGSSLKGVGFEEIPIELEVLEMDCRDFRVSGNVERETIVLEGKNREFLSSKSLSPPNTIAHLDSDPASLPPYDPETNYLSPRPRFLHYKPNPRIDQYLIKENDFLDTGNGKRLEDSFSSEISVEEDEDEDEDEEEEEEENDDDLNLLEEKDHYHPKKKVEMEAESFETRKSFRHLRHPNLLFFVLNIAIVAYLCPPFTDSPIMVHNQALHVLEEVANASVWVLFEGSSYQSGDLNSILVVNRTVIIEDHKMPSIYDLNIFEDVNGPKFEEGDVTIYDLRASKDSRDDSSTSQQVDVAETLELKLKQYESDLNDSVQALAASEHIELGSLPVDEIAIEPTVLGEQEEGNAIAIDAPEILELELNQSETVEAIYSISGLLLLGASVMAVSAFLGLLLYSKKNKALAVKEEENCANDGYSKIYMDSEMVGDLSRISVVSSTFNNGSKSSSMGRRSREEKSVEKEEGRHMRRDSAASSSISYGSFTTYERLSAKKGSKEEDVAVTPVRRSSRIRNQATSP